MAAGAIVAAALAVLVPSTYAADAFEPNDTRGTATTLLLDVARSSYLFTSGDEDFYRIVTPRAGHLRITLDVPDGVDYSLSIAEASRLDGEASRRLGRGLDEEVFLTAPSGDNIYFVRVWSNGDHSETEAYSLSATLSFFDDTYEDNSFASNAAFIDPGTYRSKVYSVDDRDWFRFELVAAGTFSLVLDVPTSSDLRLLLYSVSGELATSLGESDVPGAGSDESIGWTADGPGSFVVMVAGYPPSRSESYALTLTGTNLKVFHANRDDFDGRGGAEFAVYRAATGTWRVRNRPDVQFGQPGDIPVAGDYNGDGLADIAVYRPATGTWYVRDQPTVQFGEPGDIPVPGDYNGDLFTDMAVYRPSTGFWYVRNQLAVQFGGGADVPIPADYDGDGDDDVAVYRPATAYWYVRGQFAVQHGQLLDVPVPGDYNGDGRGDVAVYRASTGVWDVRNQFTTILGGAGYRPVARDYDGDGDTDPAVFELSTGKWRIRNRDVEVFGQAGDVPVARDVLTVNRAIADFNGDGVTDVAVYWRATGHWLVNRNFAVQFGDGDDRPVPADYDRNGVVDIAVYRPSTGMWYVRDQFGVQFGDPGDVPIPGDYDGDGRADIAVYRPSTGTWFVRNRFAVQFGDPGDIPVPGDYNGDGVTDVAVYRPSTGKMGTSATSWRCSSATREICRFPVTTTATDGWTSRCSGRPPRRGSFRASSRWRSDSPATSRCRAITTATASRIRPPTGLLTERGTCGISFP